MMHDPSIITIYIPHYIRPPESKHHEDINLIES